MNLEECLNAISDAISRTDPDSAKHFSIVWRDRFELMPHDGHTELFPNEFALLSQKDLREGLTRGVWEHIKRRIVSYSKDQKLCQAHQKR